jgi:RNA polymerase sigma factor (sigma-70 family)
MASYVHAAERGGPGTIDVSDPITDRGALPAELTRLLHDGNATERDAAWVALVRAHSRLLLHVARSVSAEHDGAMDAYAHILERLREDDFRRLRGYEADGRSTFSTWLAVVARRLCVDHYRGRYGRPPRCATGLETAEAARASRRRLLDLAAASIDLTSLADDRNESPDHALREAQLNEALDAALAKLAPADRVLLNMRFEDGFSAQQIATALKWPSPFHVYRRLNALYQHLKRVLQARGIDSSVP